MKLLLISVKCQTPRGGIAIWTEHFLRKCESMDLHYTLVNTEKTGKREKNGRRSLFDEISRTRRIFRDLKRALKTDTFDVAHLNTSCGDFGLFRDYLIARQIARKGIPVVTHYHCDIPYWIHNGLSRKCLKKLAQISRQNMVLCENSRRYLQDQFGVDSVKVPNFIEESMIRDEPKNIAPKLRRAFFVGRVSNAKGAAEMFALAKRLPDVTFELVGAVSENVAAWEKPDNILLPGPMPHQQVIACLDKADLFLFPSHSEGFSVALLESMARGVPAVATDVGANADMLADGCGIIVEKGDVDAMEQAIRELDPAERRAQMSCCAVEKVRTSYTTDAVIKLIKTFY